MMEKLIDRVRAGKSPRVEQIDPEEKDPVNGETAEEAYRKYRNGETAFVNPFHAKTMDEMRRNGK